MQELVSTRLSGFCCPNCNMGVVLNVDRLDPDGPPRFHCSICHAEFISREGDLREVSGNQPLLRKGKNVS